MSVVRFTGLWCAPPDLDNPLSRMNLAGSQVSLHQSLAHFPVSPAVPDRFLNFCRPGIAGCNCTFIMVTARRTSYRYSTRVRWLQRNACRTQKDYANIQWAVECPSIIGQPNKQAGGTSTNSRIREKLKNEEKKRDVNKHRPAGDSPPPLLPSILPWACMRVLRI